MAVAFVACGPAAEDPNKGVSPNALTDVLEIYDNSMFNGFFGGAYGATKVKLCSNEHYSTPSCALKAALKAGGAYQFGKDGGFSTAPYSHLEMSLYLDGQSIGAFAAVAKLPSGQYLQAVQLTSAHVTEQLSNGFVRLQVPLTQLNPNEVTLYAIELRNISSSNLRATWLDEVRLAGTGEPPPPPPEAELYDDFNGALYNLTTDGSTTPNGLWNVGYLSDGFVKTVQDPSNSANQYLVASPELNGLRSVRIDSTNSWPGTHGKLTARLDQQVQPPVGWYTLWPFIAYVNQTTHYYFNLKTNGWELGKKDNDHPPEEELQKFLATGSSPKAVLGEWNTIEWWVAQDATTANLRIRVDVNGVTVVNMVDDEEWQRNGTSGTGASPFFQNALKRVSLYSEASQVSWDDVYISEATSVP
jgi:hypothetical protein